MSVAQRAPRRPATPDPWPEIDRRARQHHGVIGFDQLVAAGLSPSAIQRASRSGRLLRLHRGVFRLPGTATSDLQSLAAAVAATAPASAASHRSACRLWGLGVTSPLGRTRQPEVTVARARAPRPHGVVVHRSLDLQPQHVLRRQSVVTTNPLRLLVDLGAVAPADMVADVLAQLLAERTVTMAGARAFHRQLRKRGRSGCGVLGRVLESRALGDQPCDSALEERFATLAIRHGLPAPVFQYPVQVGEAIKRIDFAYPDLLVAIELDSWRHHGMLPPDFYADRARTLELSSLGWQVVPVTWPDLDRRPQWVFDRLAIVLASAATRSNGW